MEKTFVNSVSGFIAEALRKSKALSEGQGIWFRGEGSESYKLIPNLYRKSVDGKTEYCPDIVNANRVSLVEQNIDTSFYRKASVFLANKGIENTHWNRYFLKQHYGIKTRLLDWTENALYALYFAVSGTRDLDKNGKVWILSPFELNSYSVPRLVKKGYKFSKILTCGKLEEKGQLLIGEKNLNVAELLRKYYRMDCEAVDKMYPIAIYPQHLDARMVAQQACFTLFGNIVNGLECDDAKEPFLDCINIEAQSKRSIIGELKLLGISNYSIFPDLDGLGRTINEEHANDIDIMHEEIDLENFFRIASF